MATYHRVISATWPVNSSGTVIGATGQQRSMMAVNDSQRHRTTPRGIHVDDDVAYTMEPKPRIELKTSRVGTQERLQAQLS
ncbi:hypothetical protein Tco_1405238 [Tanacetum coccineum]